MPHKFNADRRDRIPKQKYRVANWSDCSEGLHQRGDLTVWINEDAVTAFPFIHDVYPAAEKKLQHSSGMKRSQICPIALMR